MIPIRQIHKNEIKDIAPIRLDQELSIEIYMDKLKSLVYIRYNAVMI